MTGSDIYLSFNLVGGRFDCLPGFRVFRPRVSAIRVMQTLSFRPPLRFDHLHDNHRAFLIGTDLILPRQ